MKIQLLRHATLIVSIGGFEILVDPMLNPAQISEPYQDTPNPKRNPLVELPLDDDALFKRLNTLNAVLVTHTHSDHWDGKAREMLPKTIPVFCQPDDHTKIQEAGFSSVHSVGKKHDWGSIQLDRTEGQHGRGKIGELMAPVSGFVLKADGEPTVYIAGDTIWCDEVKRAMEEYKPDVVVVNAGAAQFNTGGPITMTAEDVVQVSKADPNACVIAVHMEAINHCVLSRIELMEAVVEAGVDSRVQIPQDGVKMKIDL